MDYDSAMKISASGLTANRLWMNVVSANLANASTTKTASGKPYERRTIIDEAVPMPKSFEDTLDGAMGSDGLSKVRVVGVVPDKRDFKSVFDPGHPDADTNGVVLMPNINPVEEMTDLLMASRAYEANLAAMNTAKQMALKAIEIGK